MRLLWRLLGFWKPHWLAVVLAYVTLFASTGFGLANPLVLRYAIDTGLSGGDESALVQSALLILLLHVGAGIFAYFQSYLSEYLSQHVAYDLRNALYNRIQSLSFSFHDKAQTGQLMSRVTADVEASRQFLSSSLLRMTLSFGQFVIVSAIMLTANWQLALLVLVALPVVMAISISTSRKIRPLQLQIQQQTGAYTAVLQEALAGIRVVKAFTAEAREFARFRAANWAVREKSLESNRISAFRQPMLSFFLELLTVAIVGFGGYLVIEGHMTLGTLVLFTQYRMRLAMPVRMIGGQINQATRASAAAERIFEILDTESEVKERPGAYPLTDVKGHVRYEGVSFGYGKDFMVVQDIDIDAKPGETIALLGPIGSGKSTILNLLPRFYDVTSGRITIDGHDIRDVTLESLRANVGIVMQEVFLFNATIRDNIAYGRPGATEAEIIEAAKIARLHDFIMTLPEGYDTWVGERGITLSGGQKQRVAIARTLLMDPKILVLDDSTSSVDMETEYLIQQALAELMKGRTAFIIAHRIRTIRNADQIIVLKDGRIVEQGKHEDLIAKAGLYKEIYDVQLRDQEDLARTAARSAGAEASSLEAAEGGAD
ncbi:MAG TPA: ABC transporter ATP-binding protein [Dehalococcoidia bacterium]|nr:ABC transporter ATP-binding protein [Dehalococcoidia bacterium]